MTNEPFLDPSWTWRFVVVAMSDDTTQAMVCVTLEQAGFHPVATTNDQEALALSSVLPHSPLAIITTSARVRPQWLSEPLSPLLDIRWGRRPPLLVLRPPTAHPGSSRRFVNPPDLACVLDALQALTAI